MDQEPSVEINYTQEIAALEQQISIWLTEKSPQSAERRLALEDLATFTLRSGQHESYARAVARSAANPPPENEEAIENEEPPIKSWTKDLEVGRAQCTVKAVQAQLVEETIRTRRQENPQYRQANLKAIVFLDRLMTIKQKELGERPPGVLEDITGGALLSILHKNLSINS